MHDETNYWRRKSLSRRSVMRGAGVAGVGLTTAALVGCGDDDDDTTKPAVGDATVAPTAAAQANLTATLNSGIGSDVGDMDPQSLAGTGGGNWPN